LVEAIRTKGVPAFAKAAGITIAAALLAVGTFIGPLWAVTQYSKYTIRGKSELEITSLSKKETEGLNREYAFAYSNGILEPITLFIPPSYRGPSAHLLASDQQRRTCTAATRPGHPEPDNE